MKRVKLNNNKKDNGNKRKNESSTSWLTSQMLIELGLDQTETRTLQVDGGDART